jgi:UDP-N-acetylglucosamine diphosphorylase / glucose-1-phosphate thymidylyltransferase / UDP-N-acetylgalactosamine diphosphorylase / glucosamine-1-phosphate N-acetyltransferase / galactosamine-1-phosphate N-acetyltransferase
VTESPRLDRFVADLGRIPFALPDGPCWRVIGQIETLLRVALTAVGADYSLLGPGIAVHRSATIAPSAELTGPVILGPGSRVGSYAILRGGVWADRDVTIGPHAEVKGSLLFAGSAAAHRNYVGDSVIGAEVNLEAGVVLANHYNERADRSISVLLDGNAVPTGLVKFGAVIGDGCRVGANSVTSPGTLLVPGTVVPRLTLVDQPGSSG